MSTKCIVYVAAAAAAAMARLSPNKLQTHCEGPANSPGSGVGAGPIGFNMTCWLVFQIKLHHLIELYYYITNYNLI